MPAPKGRFEERHTDLARCLALDGYRLEYGELNQIEPTIEGQGAHEDDLSAALKTCNLPDAAAVQNALDQSAEAFRREPPDYNSALTHARMETLAKSVASARVPADVNFDRASWGATLAQLRVHLFITLEEEKGLAGVYTFVSDGAHNLIGRSEQEMARLGRSMAISMCYFLVRSHLS